MIIYFSGTGNSRFVAKRIAKTVNDELFDSVPYIKEEKAACFTSSDTYIFVAPVYAAAPALVFMDFLRRSNFPKDCQAYFVMTCAGGMGSSPIYCQKLASEKELSYMGTTRIIMPQNYVPYFKTGTPDENRSVIEAALPVIDQVSDAICNDVPLPDPGTKTWERLLTPVILKPYYRLMVSAKAFYATEHCIGCGRCVQVCPLGNIHLQEKKPYWGSRCTHCMACINLCPKDAVEYGKRTQGKPRYHGPDARFTIPAWM